VGWEREGEGEDGARAAAGGGGGCGGRLDVEAAAHVLRGSMSEIG
jgi:hypothetical protein